MQQVYSPFRRQGRPNQIIDLLAQIRPEMDKLNYHFNKGEYDQVTGIYENLISTYRNFETDLGKIAFAYYKTGNLDKAESYLRHLMDADLADEDALLTLCRILVQKGNHQDAVTLCSYVLKEYSRPEAGFLQAEVFRMRKEAAKELHAYFDLVRQEGAAENPVLLLRAYTGIAQICIKENAEESEYYLNRALQRLKQSDIETVEFADMLKLISNHKTELASVRIKNMLSSYNLQFGHMIHRMHSAFYENIMNIPTVEVMLLDLTDELIEKSLSGIEQFRQEMEQRGDYILRSLNDHFIHEQPTLAYATQ